MTEEQPEVVGPEDQESAAAIAESIAQARRAGSYMVAVYSLADGKITLKRISHKFPVVDFENCVALLQNDLGGEKAGAAPPPREAMEPATPTPPVIDVFGNPPADDKPGS